MQSGRPSPVLWIPSGQRVALMPRLRRVSLAQQNALQQILVHATGRATLQDMQQCSCVTSAQVASSELIAVVLNESSAECRNILDVWNTAGAIRGVYVMPLTAKISRELQSIGRGGNNSNSEDDAAVSSAQPLPSSLQQENSSDSSSLNGSSDGDAREEIGSGGAEQGEEVSTTIKIMATLVLESPVYAEALSREWEAAWPSCILAASVGSSRKVQITVARDHNCLANVVGFLAAKEVVSWIERVLVASLKLKYATSMVQGGFWKSWPRPLWNADLLGEGEIIGIGDTGLDYDSCFFRDPNAQSIPMCTSTSPENCAATIALQPQHRKIVAYRGETPRLSMLFFAKFLGGCFTPCHGLAVTG
jgi:hypothetical protein